MKIVYKKRIVDVPDKGQEIFKRLAEEMKMHKVFRDPEEHGLLYSIGYQSVDTMKSKQLLWHWAVYNDPYLSNFLDNTVMNFNPPKAINREIQSCFVPHNGRIAVQMDWKEPKEKDK